MNEDSQIFVIKITANQERSVAMAFARIAKKEKLDIRTILAPDELKGYVLWRLRNQELSNWQSRQSGMQEPYQEEFFNLGNRTFPQTKTSVTGIKEGAIIEVTSGPFKG